MRKYQQLVLAAIAALSVVAVLLYRSENSRLRYVLDVVNVFGEDADRQQQLQHGARGEQPFEFTTPFPLWQRIGSGFHAYAAFWHRGDTKNSSSGEVTAIVVGLQKSIVSFRCSIALDDDTATVLVGRFGFIRDDLGDSTPVYNVYKFVCRIAGGVPHNRRPLRVTFAEQASKLRPQSLAVRDTTAPATTHPPAAQLRSLVACVDLVTPLPPAVRRYIAAAGRQLEFFLHHHLLGVDEFIVYDGSDSHALAVKRALTAAGVRVNYLPFNFPFADDSDGDAERRVRHVLRLDCELRTLAASSWSVLLRPNEQLLADAALQLHQHPKQQQQQQQHHQSPTTADGESRLPQFVALRVPRDAQRVELHTTPVCLRLRPSNATTSSSSPAAVKRRQQQHRIEVENVYVAHRDDMAAPAEEPVVLFRPTWPSGSEERAAAAQRLPADRVLAHQYVACRPIDHLAEATHGTWHAEIDARSQRQVVEFGEAVGGEVERLVAKAMA